MHLGAEFVVRVKRCDFFFCQHAVFVVHVGCMLGACSVHFRVTYFPEISALHVQNMQKHAVQNACRHAVHVSGLMKFCNMHCMLGAF